MQAQPKSILFSASSLSAKARLRIIASVFIVYCALCIVLRNLFHFTSLPILSVIPLVVIAWLYGTRVGLIAGLLCFPFNASVLTVFGINWVDNMVMTGGGFAGSIALILIAGIVGRLSDLSRRLGEELIARQAVEQELRLHRENLEHMVTEKVQDLLESRERFRAIAENSPDAIIITDAAGVNIYCNRGAEIMFGYGHDEIVGHNSIMFLPPEIREEEQSRRASLTQSGKHVDINATIESVMVRKSGGEFPVEFSLYSWSLSGESVYSMIIRDSSQRRQAESSVKAAAEALQRLRDFFQNVFDVPETACM